MLFNSAEYLIFLPSVLALYWLTARLGSSSRTVQNVLLLVASYLFYGWWDWRFLGLIAFSTIVDYSVGRAMGATESVGRRQLLLAVSLITNLGLLGFFKYYGFFVDSFADMLQAFGMQANRSSLNIILPVGISFYTFQTLSYTIDVYRRQIKPTHNVIDFFAFVSFFPQLVAGPIERASNLLPQFAKDRTVTSHQFASGLNQIVWGLFKKMVIADNCAQMANQAFEQSGSLPGSALVLGVCYFAFQIYGDFSGYSDIAIGTARLFGFELMTNFAYPYFARDIAEFWRRWHISLSTWFRDYVYIPLGGSRVSLGRNIRNVMIVFVVSGFWHGANWTFIIWGFLHALYFLPLMIAGSNRRHVSEVVAADRWLPSLQETGAILLTFTLTALGWIFFRAENLGQAFSYLANMLNVTNWTFPTGFVAYLPLLAIIIVLDWLGRRRAFPLDFARPGGVLQLSATCTIAWLTIFWRYTGEQEFIYFQF